MDRSVLAVEETQCGKSYMSMLKLATAITICRNKPNDLTVKQYTQLLCQNYEKAQHVWKLKCEKAEEEILKLKQEMLLYKTKSLSFGPADIDVSSEPMFPTPPSSSSDNTTSKPVFFHKNTLFLQSIIGIKKTLAENNEKQTIQFTTKQTLLANLNIIEGVVTDSELQISLANLNEGIQCVVELSNILYGNDYKEIQTKVGDIIQAVVSKIIAINGLDQSSTKSKEKFQNLVMSFMRTKHLNYLAITINILMTHCESFCDKLRNFENTINCIQYENMFYIIHCMLQSVRQKPKLLTSPEGKRFCENFQTRIDDSLLHIAHKYPIISHSMWKISGVLQLYIEDNQSDLK